MTGVAVNGWLNMSYEDGSNSGGCISGLLTLLLLPYIIVFYGYAFLAIIVLIVLEWIKENLFTILVYSIPFLLLVAILKIGLIGNLCKWIKQKRSRASYSLREFQKPTLFHPSESRNPRTFTPSTNLYCYWCTRKLGLQSWEKNGKYFCQNCYEKGYLWCVLLICIF